MLSKSVRINLSVPAKAANVIEAYADVTGRSCAAVVMEAVGLRLREWELFLLNRGVKSEVSAIFKKGE